MASGKISLSRPSGSSMVGYISWSSTSNGSIANTSTVSAALYLKKDSSYTTTGTFSGKLTIDGSSVSVSKYGTWKDSYVKVGSMSKTVAHNSDGSKSITISTRVSNTGTTQAGTYSASKSVALDTIERASSITSSASWTAGNSLTVKIDRHSSSFTHTVTAYVGQTPVASASGVTTSVTFSSKAFHTKVFKALAQNSDVSTKISVATYSGTDKIGESVYKNGTLKAPAASTFTYVDKVAVGQVQDIKVNSIGSAYCHKLKYIFKGTQGYIIGTSSVPGKEVSNKWQVPTAFYQLMKDKDKEQCQLVLTTYYTGASDAGTAEYVQVGSPISNSFTVNVIDSEPLFTNFTLIDSNEKTNALTKDHNIMIAGYSTAKAIINTSDKAIARNAADMKSYTLETGGQSDSVNYSDTEAVTLQIEKMTGNIVSVSAYDSRKLRKTVSKKITLKEYKPITITNISLQRVNGVDTRTILELDVSIWNEAFCDTVSNQLIKCEYQYCKTGTKEWSKPSEIQTSHFTYNAEKKLYHLSEEIIGDHQDGFELAGSYDVRVIVGDRLSESNAQASINSGYPGIYLKRLDESNGNVKQVAYQVGINCVPDESLGGGLHVAGNSITLNGAGLEIPIGSVMGWFSDKIPAGWLLLDGTIISRTKYAELFGVLGTTYGSGDGSTTFAIPDMKSKVAVGKSTSTQFNALGKTGGEITHTLTTSEIPAHTHGSAGSHNHSVPNTANGINGTAVRAESWANASSSGRTLNTGSGGTHTHTSVGESKSHNNLQPYIVLNYIIKAK